MYIVLPALTGVPGPPRESGPDPLTMGALSGATLINTLESSTPVALRDLKTGQHVPCLGSLQDLTLSATPRWCEVTNYVSPRVWSACCVYEHPMFVTALHDRAATWQDAEPVACWSSSPPEGQAIGLPSMLLHN